MKNPYYFISCRWYNNLDIANSRYSDFCMNVFCNKHIIYLNLIRQKASWTIILYSMHIHVSEILETTLISVEIFHTYRERERDTLRLCLSYFLRKVAFQHYTYMHIYVSKKYVISFEMDRKSFEIVSPVGITNNMRKRSSIVNHELINVTVIDIKCNTPLIMSGFIAYFEY